MKLIGQDILVSGFVKPRELSLSNVLELQHEAKDRLLFSHMFVMVLLAVMSLLD